MTYDASFYNDALDSWTSKYAGKILRIYDVLPSGLVVPAGTILAELTIPNPSHNAAGFNSGANRYEANMTGTWSDPSANASGTPLGFIIGSGSPFIVIASGSARGPGNPGADIVLSTDTLTAGAPFSITKFLQFLTVAS